MAREAMDAYLAARLTAVHAPLVVGVPPANAFRDLVQLPDGELRSYGSRDECRVYARSRDCGLSWAECPVPEGAMGAAVRSPWSGEWLTVMTHGGHAHFAWRTPDLGERGTYVLRASALDGPCEATRITGVLLGMPRQPLALKHRPRWITATAFSPGDSPSGCYQPVVLYSDDDGHSWEQVVLPPAPPHTIGWPHQGVRWQNGAVEPTVVELSDGRLYMLMRTSQDCHYQAYSEDGGASWSAPEPSRFFATLTMPTLQALADGRILALWCNTAALPEFDHEAQLELNANERQGGSEDVFTNRDAFHAAISDDDGKSWRGFRELLLNERRNDGDFRSSGGNAGSLDKSIHQSQAVELPGGKVLVSVGQHAFCRRLVIFDPSWLLEAERSDDFHLGLSDWSVHQYLKSMAGNFRGIAGHCSFNRCAGARLVPDPAGTPREVLHVARYPDPRLVLEPQGAVWNFPAGQAGEVSLELRVPRGGQGVRLCVTDHWFNPVDPVVDQLAQIVVLVDGVGRVAGSSAFALDIWQALSLRWDCQAETAAWRLDENEWQELPYHHASQDGLSYLHLQSAAESSDPIGVLLASVRAASPLLTPLRS